MIRNIGIVEQVRLWDSLITYWRFNETSGTNADDATANNKDGTLGNSAAFNSGGKNGYCVRLNNAAYPYVSFAKKDFEYNQAWSFSTWIKREAISFYFCWLYVDSKQQDPYSGWRIGYNNVNKLHVQIQNNSTYYILKYGNSTITDTTTWHNVVFTYNGNGLASGVKYYLDGVESTWTADTDNLQSKSLISAASYGYIGNIDNLISYNAQAYFDEYGIWNRELNATEAKMLYSAGNGKFY